MDYRVDELAARAGTSVDTVRYYQARGLLEPPARRGRAALYGDEHLDRLRRIRSLKDKGFSLASIERVLQRDLDPADGALVDALVGRPLDDATMTLDELAGRTGVSVALLDALAREGLLAPTVTPEGPRYTARDAEAVAAGLELLGEGLPLGELLALAREHDAAMRTVARRAVDLFGRFVRDPLKARGAAPEELTAAFSKMLDASGALVERHFRRVLLEEAEARVADEL